MTTLDALTLAMLWSNRPALAACEPSDFNGLAEEIERLKSNPDDALRDVLRRECGIEWTDGKLSDAVIAEAKRRAAIERARKLIDKRVRALMLDKSTLEHENIAGRELVDAAVARIGES